MKKQKKNNILNIENEQENNMLDNENDNENEQSFDDIDFDEYELNESIRTQLENLGIDTKGDIKFILMKKDEYGKMSHIRTYHNDLPDVDTIAQQFGGGDYYIKVLVDILQIPKQDAVLCIMEQ